MIRIREAWHLAPLLASLTFAAPLRAQAVGAVRGVVYDSIVGAPLAGAEVWLEGVSRTAVTDRAGTFRLDSVAPGAYTITFGHASLDSLGLGAPFGRVVVTAGDTTHLQLSMPSMLGIARRLCPADTTSAAGAIVGVVRDASAAIALPNARVDVRWSEFNVGDRTSGTHEYAKSATTSANGRYLVCGVPNDVVVSVQATIVDPGNGATRRTGLALVDVRDRVLTWHDVSLGVAPRAPGIDATVLVTFVDRQGHPIAGAQARVGAEAEFRTATDDGHLRLAGHGAGPATLEVRALGYLPATVKLDGDARSENTQIVRLERSAVPLLETVRVIGSAHASPEMAGYELRKRSGAGYFIERDEIERHQPTRLTQVLRRVPGLRFERTSPTDVTVSSARTSLGALGGSCPMGLVVDGQVIRVDPSEAPIKDLGVLGPGARGTGTSGGGTVSKGADATQADMSYMRRQTIDDFVSPQAIEAIEVYPGTNGPPLQYGRFPCGAILVWTRAVAR